MSETINVNQTRLKIFFKRLNDVSRTQQKKTFLKLSHNVSQKKQKKFFLEQSKWNLNHFDSQSVKDVFQQNSLMSFESKFVLEKKNKKILKIFDRVLRSFRFEIDKKFFVSTKNIDNQKHDFTSKIVTIFDHKNQNFEIFVSKTSLFQKNSNRTLLDNFVSSSMSFDTLSKFNLNDWSIKSFSNLKLSSYHTTNMSQTLKSEQKNLIIEQKNTNSQQNEFDIVFETIEFVKLVWMNEKIDNLSMKNKKKSWNQQQIDNRENHEYNILTKISKNQSNSKNIFDIICEKIVNVNITTKKISCISKKVEHSSWKSKNNFDENEYAISTQKLMNWSKIIFNINSEENVFLISKKKDCVLIFSKNKNLNHKKMNELNDEYVISNQKMKNWIKLTNNNDK